MSTCTTVNLASCLVAKSIAVSKAFPAELEPSVARTILVIMVYLESIIVGASLANLKLLSIPHINPNQLLDKFVFCRDKSGRNLLNRVFNQENPEVLVLPMRMQCACII